MNPHQNKPQASQPAKGPGWQIEQDAIRSFGDRKTRVILAVFHARRSAHRKEFFVHPKIAKLNGLSPSDLTWGLERLEGRLVETRVKKKGAYRLIRLLPPYEETERRDRRAGALPTSGLPDEEKMRIDTEEVIARASVGSREPSADSLAVLTELAQSRGAGAAGQGASADHGTTNTPD